MSQHTPAARRAERAPVAGRAPGGPDTTGPAPGGHGATTPAPGDSRGVVTAPWTSTPATRGERVVLVLGLGIALAHLTSGAAFALVGALLVVGLTGVVPAALRLLLSIEDKRDRPTWVRTLAGVVPPAALAAALGLLARGTTGSPQAALLTAPWLAVAAACAGYGARRFARRRRRLSWPDLAQDAALVYLLVSGFWVTMYAAGLAPGGYAMAIVLLTGVHYAYAGFGALVAVAATGAWLGLSDGVATERAGRAPHGAVEHAASHRRGSARLTRWPVGTGVRRWYTAATALMIAGMALVAVGISTTVVLEALTVTAFVAGTVLFSGLLIVQVTPRVTAAGPRWLIALAAGALVVSMLLALAYAWGRVVTVGPLTISIMARTHGLLNAAAVAMALLAWLELGRRSSRRAPPAAGATAVVLGVAQDGGVPHAGCDCQRCAAAAEDPATRRRPACLGLVDQGAGKHWLVDATPALPEQWAALRQLGAGTDLAGILLTHAHMGHYTGLIHLGEEAAAVSGVKVWASSSMAEFLRSHSPWRDLERGGYITLRTLDAQPISLSPAITVAPVPVPHRCAHSDTLAFLIAGRERRLFYCPDIDDWDAWHEDVANFLVREHVAVALVDGTFLSATELRRRDIAAVPHPLATDTARRVRDIGCDVRLVHLNHTNPLLDDPSLVEGIGVAQEGDKLGL